MADDLPLHLYTTELVQGLLNYEPTKGTLPPPGVPTTMALFLDSYSLHDSYWETLVAEDDFPSDMVLRFDAFWAEGRISHPGSRVSKWPRMIVTMSGLTEAQFDMRGLRSIATATSAPHSEHEAKAETMLRFSDGGSITLVHDPEVALRMIDPVGDLIPIPL